MVARDHSNSASCFREGHLKALAVGLDYNQLQPAANIPQGRTFPGLRAGSRDAYVFAQALEEYYPDAKTMLLTENLFDRRTGERIACKPNLFQIPTKANVIRGWQWLYSGAQPNDALLFYFAGHSTRLLPPLSSGSPVNAEEDWEVLALLDDFLLLTELHDMQAGVSGPLMCAFMDTSHGCNVFDTCPMNHSSTTARAFEGGSGIAGMRRLPPHVAPSSFQANTPRPRGNGVHACSPNALMFTFAACDPNTSSAREFFSPKSGHAIGFFTFCLCNALMTLAEEHNGNTKAPPISVMKLFNVLRDYYLAYRHHLSFHGSSSHFFNNYFLPPSPILTGASLHPSLVSFLRRAPTHKSSSPNSNSCWVIQTPSGTVLSRGPFRFTCHQESLPIINSSNVMLSSNHLDSHAYGTGTTNKANILLPLFAENSSVMPSSQRHLPIPQQLRPHVQYPIIQQQQPSIAMPISANSAYYTYYNNDGCGGANSSLSTSPYRTSTGQQTKNTTASTFFSNASKALPLISDQQKQHHYNLHHSSGEKPTTNRSSFYSCQPSSAQKHANNVAVASPSMAVTPRVSNNNFSSSSRQIYYTTSVTQQPNCTHEKKDTVFSSPHASTARTVYANNRNTTTTTHCHTPNTHGHNHLLEEPSVIVARYNKLWALDKHADVRSSAGRIEEQRDDRQNINSHQQKIYTSQHQSVPMYSVTRLPTMSLSNVNSLETENDDRCTTPPSSSIIDRQTSVVIPPLAILSNCNTSSGSFSKIYEEGNSQARCSFYSSRSQTTARSPGRGILEDPLEESTTNQYSYSSFNPIPSTAPLDKSFHSCETTNNAANRNNASSSYTSMALTSSMMENQLLDDYDAPIVTSNHHNMNFVQQHYREPVLQASRPSKTIVKKSETISENSVSSRISSCQSDESLPFVYEHYDNGIKSCELGGVTTFGRFLSKALWSKRRDVLASAGKNAGGRPFHLVDEDDECC